MTQLRFIDRLITDPDDPHVGSRRKVLQYFCEIQEKDHTRYLWKDVPCFRQEDLEDAIQE